MELYYNLGGVYNPKPIDQEFAQSRGEELIESSYIEESDVIELAIETNSVLLVEEELEDGDMEFLVVTNKGKVRYRGKYSFVETDEARNKIEKVGAENYFTKTMLKDIDKLAKEYEMNRNEFIHDYLSAYYMDIYENKKNKYIDNLQEYYVE